MLTLTRAVQLLALVLTISGCAGTPEQTQVQQAIDPTTEKGKAALRAILQATYDNCKTQMQDYSLDPIRGKVELLHGISANNDGPPALTIMNNNAIPTPEERYAIGRWAALLDACNARSPGIEFDLSNIDRDQYIKLNDLSGRADQQDRTLVSSLYNGQLTHSQFARKRAAIDNKFNAAAQLLENDQNLTVQEAVARISQQLPIPDTAMSGFSAAQNQDEVKLEKHGGIYAIPVRINDRITLDFVLDSGASEVLIPADVFTTLVRTGTVSEHDLIGKGIATLANGSQTTTYSFVLRELKVGRQVVTNITASIGPAASTPLLGQSFLSKLKSWTLDNARHVLLITDKRLPSALTDTP